MQKRTVVLVDPKFQFKFVLVVTSLVFLSSLFYPLAVHQTFDYFLEMNLMSEAKLQQSRNTLMTFLTLFQLGFTLIVAFICIFVSHKIAGPLYKLRLFLSDVAQTGRLRKISFRKGDNFQDLAEDYNQAISKIQENRKNHLQLFEDIQAYLKNIGLIVPEDKKPLLEEILRRLEEQKNLD